MIHESMIYLDVSSTSPYYTRFNLTLGLPVGSQEQFRTESRTFSAVAYPQSRSAPKKNRVDVCEDHTHIRNLFIHSPIPLYERKIHIYHIFFLLQGQKQAQISIKFFIFMRTNAPAERIHIEVVADDGVNRVGAGIDESRLRPS